MKYKDWWYTQGMKYVEDENFPKYPALHQYFKEATHEAWVAASKEGRYTAGKSVNGPLYNTLKKLGFSNNIAGKITKRVTKFVIGVD